MRRTKIGVFIEDEWVAISYFPVLQELKLAGYVPLLITTNKEWGEGMRKSIPLDDEPVFRLMADLSIHEVTDISDFAGFVFPGGYWADRLRWWLCKKTPSGEPELPAPRDLLVRILRSDNHVIGVICHSMWVLISAKEFLDNHARSQLESCEVTCAYNIIHDVKNAGFVCVDKDVHVHGNLVTGRMSDVSRQFIRAYIETLGQSKG